MSNIFYYAISFNQQLNNWDVSSVKNKKDMFDGTQITKLPEWYNN